MPPKERSASLPRPRLRVLALAGCLCLPFPVLAEHDDPIRVRFVNPGFATAGFWRAVTDAMRAAGDQLGMRLEVSYGNREWPRMRENARVAIATSPPPDYLVLVNEHRQAADLVRAADDRGLPTFLLLNTLTPAQEARIGRPRTERLHWLGSLTPDNAAAGREMAASIIAAARRLHPERPRLELMTLAGDFATPASVQRLAGLDVALARHPEVVERRRLRVNWSYAEAYQRIDTWLNAGRRFDAVWAANDPIALGAIDAAEAHGLQAGRDFAVAGLNWSAAALEKVLAGEMTLTHGGHVLAGAWAMVLLHDHCHGVDFAREGPHLRFAMAALEPSVSPALREVLATQAWSRIDFRAFSRALDPSLEAHDFSLDALREALLPAPD